VDLKCHKKDDIETDIEELGKKYLKDSTLSVKNTEKINPNIRTRKISSK
jgi:hypothetical protein